MQEPAGVLRDTTVQRGIHQNGQWMFRNQRYHGIHASLLIMMSAMMMMMMNRLLFSTHRVFLTHCMVQYHLFVIVSAGGGGGDVDDHDADDVYDCWSCFEQFVVKSIVLIREQYVLSDELKDPNLLKETLKSYLYALISQTNAKRHPHRTI